MSAAFLDEVWSNDVEADNATHFENVTMDTTDQDTVVSARVQRLPQGDDEKKYNSEVWTCSTSATRIGI